MGLRDSPRKVPGQSAGERPAPVWLRAASNLWARLAPDVPGFRASLSTYCPKPRTRSLPLLVLALLLPACRQEEETVPQLEVRVQTEPVRREDVQVDVSAPATIFPRSETRLSSSLTAPIVGLGAGQGDRVRAGQVLVRLRKDDIEAECAEAEAQVADARANLEKVSAGTLPTDIERARGEVERTQAALAEAEQIYKRRVELAAEGALPQREVLVSKTQYEQARTAHRVAEKSLALLESRSREQDLRMAQSRLDQAQARLDYLKTRLGYAEIRCPFAGVITEQFQYPGDMAGPDTPIFTLMDLSTVVARGQFPEEKAADVRLGQPCRFEKIDSPSQGFEGRTTVVSQAVDSVRRTVEVWCRIPNPAGALKSGLFGKTTVVTGIHPGALTVPAAAVDFDQGRSDGVVWTVSDDRTAHENRVSVGVIRGERAEILEGLQVGETVVAAGGYGLYEGVKLATAPPPDGEKPQ